MRKLLLSALVAAVFPAAAQSIPAANYTDMWWNSSQSGWGISFMQHTGSNQAYATWYTYDPRQVDAATGAYKPLWIVMSGGTWVASNRITGDAYVLNGAPYNQAGSNRAVTRVGTFTMTFTDASNGTFQYNIAAPSNLASTDPAYGLPSMSGSLPISRFAF
jgi:hypothetical protein